MLMTYVIYGKINYYYYNYYKSTAFILLGGVRGLFETFHVKSINVLERLYELIVWYEFLLVLEP